MGSNPISSTMTTAMTYQEEEYKSTILKWGVALIILNIADVFSTHALFAVGGIELNPVANLFINILWLALLIKTLVPAFVVWRSKLTPTRFIRNAMIGVTIFYALILVNNLFHLTMHYI